MDPQAPLDLGELPRVGERTPAPRRRRPRWLLPVVVGVVALALLAALVDHRMRSEERERLAACGDRAWSATVRADQVLGSMAEYLRPAFGFDGSVDRAGLWPLMSEAATRARSPLAEAEALCEGVEVLGLHRSHVAERATHLAYLRARLAFVDEIVADGSAAATQPEDLARLREEAFGDRS